MSGYVRDMAGSHIRTSVRDSKVNLIGSLGRTQESGVDQAPESPFTMILLTNGLR